MILPESITPDVTTGHAAHSEALNKRYNDLNGCHVWVSEGSTEADIVAALAEVHDFGRGSVTLMGDSYTASADPAFEVNLPGIDFNLGQAVIDYTGSGVCVLFAMDPFTIDKAGTLRGGVIDGAGAGNGATGLRYGGLIAGAIDGTIVQNFDGVGSVGENFHNGPSAFTERCNIRTEVRNCTTDYLFTKDVSANPSMFYNDFDLKFNVDTGQTAFKTAAGVQLYDCALRLKGNVDNTGTIFDLDPGTSTLARPYCDIVIEQTNGTGATLFDGDVQPALPYGRPIQVNGFGSSFDSRIVVADWGGSGVTAVMDQRYGDLLVNPLGAAGLAIGTGFSAPYVVTYVGAGGDDGNGFFVLAKGSGDEIPDCTVAFHVASSGLVTTAIGYTPGSYTTALRNVLGPALPAGTTVYDSDLEITVTWTGTEWHDGVGATV